MPADGSAEGGDDGSDDRPHWLIAFEPYWVDWRSFPNPKVVSVPSWKGVYAVLYVQSGQRV